MRESRGSARRCFNLYRVLFWHLHAVALPSVKVGWIEWIQDLSGKQRGARGTCPLFSKYDRYLTLVRVVQIRRTCDGCLREHARQQQGEKMGRMIHQRSHTHFALDVKRVRAHLAVTPLVSSAPTFWGGPAKQFRRGANYHHPTQLLQPTNRGVARRSFV